MIDREVETQQDGQRFSSEDSQQPGDHSLKVFHVGPPKSSITAMHFCNLCVMVSNHCTPVVGQTTGTLSKGGTGELGNSQGRKT